MCETISGIDDRITLLLEREFSKQSSNGGDVRQRAYQIYGVVRIEIQFKTAIERAVMKADREISSLLQR